MNEQALKHAFEDVVASSPPPSMDPAHALAVARKARSRRRSSLAGAAVAVLVVVVGAGSVITFGQRTDDVLGVGPSSSSPRISHAPEHEPVRPLEGRTDRVPGDPDASFSERLMAKVQVFAQGGGYQTGPLPSQPNDQMMYNQTLIQPRKGQDPEWLSHNAGVSIHKGDGKVGRLEGSVSPPVPRKDPCELTMGARHGISAATCQVAEFNGKRVAVETRTDLLSAHLSVLYQAPNGTLVTISALAGTGNGLPPLDAVPFTAEQLASLATDSALVPEK